MFQKSFKYYKSRNPRPDLSKLTEVFKDNVNEIFKLNVINMVLIH